MIPNNSIFINQDSFNTEYYTPAYIIERVRSVLGEIDLDPASSVIANRTVKAKRFFSEEDNGLSKEWTGKVWMNHPFNKAENKTWITKLCYHYAVKDITEGCCITYASTSEAWFQPLLYFPQCFISKRVNYVLPSGDVKKGATKGSVVTYLGKNLLGFYEQFNDLGTVKVSLGYMQDLKE